MKTQIKETTTTQSTKKQKNNKIKYETKQKTNNIK